MPVLIGAAALVVVAAVIITVLALQGSPQPAASSGTGHHPSASSPAGSSPSSTAQATPTVVPAPAPGLKPLAALVVGLLAHGWPSSFAWGRAWTGPILPDPPSFGTPRASGPGRALPIPGLRPRGTG